MLPISALHDALKAKANSLGQILEVGADGKPVVQYVSGFDPSKYKDTVENFIESGRDTLYINGEKVAEKVVKLGANGEPSYVNYTPVFVVAAVVSILCLAILAIFYKKNKQYDLSKDVHIDTNGEKGKKVKIKELPISKGERKSLITMLAALFLINNATEAIVPNFTNFALDTLGVKPIYSTLMMAVFAVSLAVFGIPAGIMGRKLGRKKTIIIGLACIVAMFIAYITVSQVFSTNRMFVWIMLWIALVVGGAAVGCININTLPLVLAIGGREYVGTFTGYYFTATFSAAITGPILCGWLIGLFNEDYNFMFLFCAIFFAIGLAVITQVKHGESSPEDEEWIKEAVDAADD